MTHVGAVLFDFGGTLDAPGIPWKERLFELYRAEGVAVTHDAFAPLFYRADDALVGAVPAALSFQDTVRRLVDGVSAALHVDDPRLTERIAAQFVQRAMSCAHDNTRLLSQLAGRYRLGMVSNFYGNLATVCDELGLRPYLGVIADSTDVGWTKPDPHIFRHALDELGVTAAEAAFVGDSLARDMAGARGIGMSHIWLVGGSVTPSAPCCPGDPVIHSLDDLRELLL